MPIDSNAKMRAAIDWKRKSDAWVGFKTIVAITRDHLKRGNTTVEFLPKNILVGGGENSPIDEGPIVAFGKYRGKSIQWLRDNDSGYLSWLKENVAAYKNV